MSTRKTLKERLEEKFYVTPGCWIWTGACGSGSSGKRPSMQHLGKWANPARTSYELYVGPIPEGMLIRHKCDNPLCVNPDHLEPGTFQDNSNDMVKRGRSHLCGLKGSISPRSVLTEIQVDYIRLLLKDRFTDQRDIAVLFGVSPQTISAIATGVTWKHHLSPGQQGTLF